jgi:hypothetical protein
MYYTDEERGSRRRTPGAFFNGSGSQPARISGYADMGPMHYARKQEFYREDRPTRPGNWVENRRAPTPQPQLQSAQSDYWYTPELVLKTVEDIIGQYFDPCPVAPDFDGLGVPWENMVFINPPFSKIREFIQKGMAEYIEGKTFLWLVNADFKTEVGTQLLDVAAAIAITKEPIQFKPGHDSLRGLGNKFNSVFLLWTNDPEIVSRFATVLASNCLVLKQV